MPVGKRCGASHVALGTVLFSDPDAPSRVRVELAAEAMRLGFADPVDAFCAAFESVVRVEN